MGRTAKLAREALAALERYDWPGNVRELKNALERSLVVGQGAEIMPGDLPQEVMRGDAAPIRDARRLDTAGLGETDFREAKRKFEIAYIRGKLEQNRWNVSRTAASIGLHRQSLQEKLRELGIRRPGRGRDLRAMVRQTMDHLRANQVLLRKASDFQIKYAYRQARSFRSRARQHTPVAT